MKVSELLKPEFVIAELSGSKKEDVINELINLFGKDPRVIDLEKVRSAVLEREKIMSTGVGKGFAIPHGKTSAVTEILAAFGKTARPIDYQSLDSQPVHLVFPGPSSTRSPRTTPRWPGPGRPCTSPAWSSGSPPCFDNSVF